mmetsp:Transcript_34718/g.84006  ORF Transcript_34718/g.84006 Transcript_34718/m.84006 type:complete len:88 (+) Transcript_34718:1830-2093(+)
MKRCPHKVIPRLKVHSIGLHQPFHRRQVPILACSVEAAVFARSRKPPDASLSSSTPYHTDCSKCREKEPTAWARACACAATRALVTN